MHKFPFLNAAHNHLAHHQEEEDHHGPYDHEIQSNHADHQNIFSDLFSEFQALPIEAV